ncbi:MAG: hypothetical protein EHM27_00955 [Deltaproteobacteria bacterium]|nr:MAG: hypothetical protein EHM27_00955 [Deltaproteobacteria bacterium]
MKAPPGNHLEALKGDRSGQYRIRIQDQGRVCFRLNLNHGSDLFANQRPISLEADGNHGEESSQRKKQQPE